MNSKRGLIGLLIGLSIVWFAGSIYWYDCQIKKVCKTVAQAAPISTPEPIVEKPTPIPEPTPEPIVEKPAPIPEPTPEPIVEKPAPIPEPTPEPIVEKPIATFNLEEADIGFEFGEVELSSKYDDVVKSLATYMVNTARPLIITGHTDTLGDSNINFIIGQMRANNLKLDLIAQGVDESLISTQTKGETTLKQQRDLTIADHVINRRLELKWDE